MRSIETLNTPLVYRVADADGLYEWPDRGEEIHIRTLATALTGMQKEALVGNSQAGTVWRMVCDEGPYLNGTDLAPFPLAFFTTGLVLSYMSEIEALAKQRGIALRRLVLRQDNRYTMEGSALKGTMIGGALPVDLAVSAQTDASAEAVSGLVQDAVAACPANALLNTVMDSLFTLSHNGAPLPVQRVCPLDGPAPPDPGPVFAQTRPVSPPDFASDIITKLEDAPKVTGEGGAGSSLTAEQKRMLHVQGVASRRSDGLAEVTINLFKPVGSRFHFIGDDLPRFGGQGRAPSGLDYLSAGIAFCYLTQLGRFTHIAKKSMDAYAIVQDTAFSLPGASGGTGRRATAEPVETHVYVHSPETAEDMQTLTDMGEQTCFLHAACRSALKTKIRIEKAA